MLRIGYNKLISRQLSSVTTQGLSQFGGVHGSKTGASRMWRNKPLLRRDGDRVFKTGAEASGLLMQHARVIDSGANEFLTSCESVINSLSVVFDRMPKYAWIMKQMIEPERTISFRVCWIDDTGIMRVNRGFRVQHSSGMYYYFHYHSDSIQTLYMTTNLFIIL
jgi:glutamate dehydrogenase (NADP+)